MKTLLTVGLCLLSVIVARTVAIPTVSLAITAEKRFLQIVWYDLNSANGGRIFITNQPPHSNLANLKPLAVVKPKTTTGWITTAIKFDYEISRSTNVSTTCYGYWATYINASGQLEALGCLRVRATWMNDLRPGIDKMRMADLFIPGTHDSGSYRVNLNPGFFGRLFTRYKLTQDEDIRGQLMHGARYLDIRPSYVGWFGNKEFYVNHGWFRQRPMAEVVEHVRKFVLETKEIVIFGMKEFPVGFSNSVHMKFVAYLEREFAGLLIDPDLTWDVTLGELWNRKQYIFLAYDKLRVVARLRTTLFICVRQRWGNVDEWPELQEYLRDIYEGEMDPLNTRPMADMAELTPGFWGAIFNRYGGLRRLADNVNSGVSNLYRNELGLQANIVAVDYLRGTTIVDLAIELNRNKTN